METPAQSPAPARSPRVCTAWAAKPACAVLIALGSALLAAGCGDSVQRPPSSDPLVTGRRAVPLPPAQLASAAAEARAFARVWAPTVYLRRPPPLPGATSLVRRAQLDAAARVPAARRPLRPRLSGVELKIVDTDRVEANVHVADGRSPRFTLGATLALRRGRWIVVSISTPG